MDPRDAVMLTIQQEEGGQLTGRTLLQKKLYFACVLADEDFGFVPHYYGPYSQSVADAVTSLTANHFVEETTETFPGEPNLFGERRRHSYSLTDDGKAVLAVSEKLPETEKWQAFLRKVNSHSVAENFNLLSVAAKIHLIVKAVGKATRKEIQDQAKRYGWKVSDEDIEKVEDYLLNHLRVLTRVAPVS
jgi:uncharacterized protein YwgA